ncbi:MAG: AraC family transcriptional regulator [Prevotella sp.]|nr:AraC family transcriptional regulator [Alistipes senegalensis]MCM1357304.1 AraC family transcriptional regulator [Prevotella sp.]MCM1473559.1 AraC family transcriptional regulator [Muribaculaceae bacterium]
MNWINGIQNALDYIENHITDNLDYAEIAKQAYCSVFYFQRIFNALCGMTIGEYIRKRRLTLAGSELYSEKSKVIDVALKYGYESPESFTRAFVKFHGITPSEARRNGSSLKSFSRLSVKIILKGGNTMNYSIVEKKSFKVLSKTETHSVIEEQDINTIPDFWDKAHKTGIIETLLKNASDKTYIFGICYGNTHTSQMTFDYSIAVECGENVIIPEGYTVSEIPARTWIVAECIGAMPEAIQKLWHELCAEFFPTSEYKPTYEMDIEAYPAGNMISPDYKCQIWIPIEKG